MKTAKPYNERIWLSVFIVLFLYVVILYIPQIIMGSVGISAPASDLINLVIYSLFWFWVIPFGFRLPVKVGSLKDYLTKIRLYISRPSDLMLGIGLGGLYLLIMAGISLLMGSFSPNITNVMPPQNWVLLWGNIGAFFEEVAIRGVILVLLLKRYDKTKAVLLSALIFGAGHIITFFLGNELLFSIIQVGYAFFLGVLFAALVIKTGSLVPGILAHMVINSFSQILQSAYGVNDAYLLLVSSILTTIISLVLLRHKPGDNDGEAVLP